MGAHSDLEGMAYGALYEAYVAYVQVAVLDQIMEIDDARMAAWKLAQDEGASILVARTAGLKAAVVRARELGM